MITKEDMDASQEWSDSIIESKIFDIKNSLKQTISMIVDKGKRNSNCYRRAMVAYKVLNKEANKLSIDGLECNVSEERFHQVDSILCDLEFDLQGIGDNRLNDVTYAKNVLKGLVKPLKWYRSTDRNPPISHEYVVVRKDGQIGIDYWANDQWENYPASVLFWTYTSLIIPKGVEPNDQ